MHSPCGGGHAREKARAAGTFQGERQGIRLSPGQLHGPQAIHQRLPRAVILDAVEGAVAVVVGDHQVMGDVDHDVVEGDEVFADGVGEGRAVWEVEVVEWVRD
ncbi:hypothetical protein JNA92_07545 [Pseudomonas putida]|nr:hypothetical protein [Pseudomonas putida]